VWAFSSPVYDQGLTDAEQHDGDLSDGEETPDRGLLHEVWGDEAGKIRSENEEEDPLDDHSFLFVEGKERREHQEGVNGGPRNDVGWVCHWDGPSKMVVSSIGTNFISSQPFGGWPRKSLFPNSRQEVSSEQHSSSNEAKSLNDLITIEVSRVFREGSVNDVTEVRLQADVKEAGDGQELVDVCVADGRIEVRRDEKILYGLKELHREEEKDSGGESGVASFGINPIGAEQTDRRKNSRHFHRKTHLCNKPQKPKKSFKKT